LYEHNYFNSVYFVCDYLEIPRGSSGIEGRIGSHDNGGKSVESEGKFSIF